MWLPRITSDGVDYPPVLILVSLSCMCLLYGFVRFFFLAVAVLNVLAGAGDFCVVVRAHGQENNNQSCTQTA
jgi:hypothetical protein